MTFAIDNHDCTVKKSSMSVLRWLTRCPWSHVVKLELWVDDWMDVEF